MCKIKTKTLNHLIKEYVEVRKKKKRRNEKNNEK